MSSSIDEIARAIESGLPAPLCYEQLLTTDHAMLYLKVSRKSLDRIVARGELPRIKVGGSNRYSLADLRTYVAARRTTSETIDAAQSTATVDDPRRVAVADRIGYRSRGGRRSAR